MQRASLREKLFRPVQRSEPKRAGRGKYTVHEDPMIYATYFENPSFLSGPAFGVMV